MKRARRACRKVINEEQTISNKAGRLHEENNVLCAGRASLARTILQQQRRDRKLLKRVNAAAAKLASRRDRSKSKKQARKEKRKLKKALLEPLTREQNKRAQEKYDERSVVSSSSPCQPGAEAVYDRGLGEFEIVKVVKVHSEGEGGSITIFVPSLGHERSTIKNRLKFGAAAVTAHRTKNEASSNEPISIGHKSKDKSTRNIRRSGKFAPAVVHVL